MTSSYETKRPAGLATGYDGMRNRGMICCDQQIPAAVLIGSNSESFGSKLHATKLKKPALRWLFLYLPQTPVLAPVAAELRCSACRRRGRFSVNSAPKTSLFSV